MGRIKVAIVSQVFGPTGGGQARWSHAFAQALHERGFEVHVVTRKTSPAAVKLPFYLHPIPKQKRHPFQFAAAAWEVTAKLQPDLVHDMGDGWGGSLLQFHGGPYLVAAEHKLKILPRPFRPIKRWLWRLLPHYRRSIQFAAEQIRRHPGLLVALSNYQAMWIKRCYKVPGEKLRVVHNGVDIVQFTPANRVLYRTAVREYLGIEHSATMLLIVAYDYRLKGVPTLLSAAGSLIQKGHDLHVVIVGKRPRGDWFTGRLSRGLRERVTFVGAVSDPRPFYAAADVYVHPTFFDCCSLAVLEAMASGLPIITTVCNGAGELIEPGREGFLLREPGDAHGLAEKIEALLDPSLQTEMGQAAREKALQHRLERNVADILHLYDAVLGSTEGSGTSAVKPHISAGLNFSTWSRPATGKTG
jgi:UDP-glucose:(heptosyl)LPS alpha-1,3-glucosyltransferase